MINEMRPLPKFVIVCGDLVNASPLRSLEKNSTQVNDFKQIFAKLNSKIKLVCVCGNHDIGDIPTEQSVSVYREQHGDDFFSFKIGKDYYLVLNSQYFKSTQFVKTSSKNHENWLNSQFKKLEELQKDNKLRHAFISTHIPPFINSFDEPDAYFNISKNVREKLLLRAVNSGVKAWFCGHYHRNAGGFYNKSDKKLEVIVSAAVGGNAETDTSKNQLEIEGVGGLVLNKSISGIRVIKVTPNGYSHEFINLV